LAEEIEQIREKVEDRGRQKGKEMSICKKIQKCNKNLRKCVHQVKVIHQVVMVWDSAKSTVLTQFNMKIVKNLNSKACE